MPEQVKVPEFKTHRKLIKRQARPEAERIGCSDCGAPVEIKNPGGGGQVTCQACGSVMDLEDPNHKVIRKIALENRPPAILDLGRKGKLFGYEYEVIGRQMMKQTDAEGTYFWDEFLLFSPVAGYAWLDVENGHWMFSRKAKHKPPVDPTKIPEEVEISHQGEFYEVWEKGRAQVYWVEGEFPHHTQAGDHVFFMEAISPPLMLSAEWTDRELEWLAGEYVRPEKIQEAFGLDSIQEPQGVGVCQPFEWSTGKKVRTFVIGVFVLLFWIGAGVAGGVFTGSGVGSWVISPEQYSGPNAPYVTPEFFLERGLAEVTMSTAGPAWVYLRMRLLDAQGTTELLFSGAPAVAEPVRKMIQVDQKGQYRFQVSGEKVTGEQSELGSVTVSIKRNIWLARYFVIPAILLSFWLLYELATTKKRFEERREEA